MPRAPDAPCAMAVHKIHTIMSGNGDKTRIKKGATELGGSATVRGEPIPY